ncbi:MAG: hypothetical protein IJN72_03970 [Firmicutes bacterium]|nr:hypothetical protein [Bacillota bacterium]
MSNSILSILLIPAFVALYTGGISGSAVICGTGLGLMAFIAGSVLLRKKK